MAPNPEEILESITEATTALKVAAEELQKERRVRQFQIGFIVTMLVVLCILIFFSFRNSSEIKESTCDTLNAGRADVRALLVAVIREGEDGRTPEEQERVQEFLTRIGDEILPPIEC